jgi:hypothetical protein
LRRPHQVAGFFLQIAGGLVQVDICVVVAGEPAP